ncbi:MAG: hypothetical protein EOP06_26810, partial [Proteobacteria bacterium]
MQDFTLNKRNQHTRYREILEKRLTVVAKKQQITIVPKGFVERFGKARQQRVYQRRRQIQKRVDNGLLTLPNLYFTYDEAREYLHTARITTYTQFLEWFETGAPPFEMPEAPDIEYRNLWVGWEAFFTPPIKRVRRRIAAERNRPFGTIVN